MRKEEVTPGDLDQLAETNKQIMKEWGTVFGVNHQGLEQVFAGLDQFRAIKDGHERILSIAAWITYAMAKERPFFNGNKRTGALAAIRFLNANGYDIYFELLDVKSEFADMLIGVQRGNADYTDILKFMKKRARHL